MPIKAHPEFFFFFLGGGADPEALCIIYVLFNNYVMIIMSKSPS